MSIMWLYGIQFRPVDVPRYRLPKDLAIGSFLPFTRLSMRVDWMQARHVVPEGLELRNPS